MVMFILLGLIDVLSAAVMLSLHFGIIDPGRWVIASAVYLIGKALALRGSFLSIIDVAAGVYILLMLLGLRTFLVYVFALIMLYKFVTSLLMRGMG